MLDANIKTQLKAYLERMHAADRARRLARRQREASREMRELLSEIAALSPPDQRCARDGDDARRPSFAIGRRASDIARALRRPADGPRIHLAGAGAAAGRRPSAEGRRRT